MTDRERLDAIGELVDSRRMPPMIDVDWLIALARRLLAVKEAADAVAYASLDLQEALADLDEWRDEQP